MFTNLFKKIYSFIESQLGFKKFGRASIIKFPYRIWSKDRIEIGNEVFIAEYSFFAVLKVFGDQKFNPLVKIGDNVRIGSNFFIASINSVIIENNVIISDRVFVADHAHQYTDIKVPISQQPLESKGKVLIKSGSFIGVNTVIMPGVSIGKNSVVGASSVVTKSVPDYAVVAGIPARIIKKYNPKNKKMEEYLKS